MAVPLYVLWLQSRLQLHSEWETVLSLQRGNILNSTLYLYSIKAQNERCFIEFNKAVSIL